MAYKCDYCNSTFHLQYYKDNHVIFCEKFLNKTRKEKEFMFDRKLNDNERDKLLRNLLYDFEKQKKEIEKLKKEISSLKKRQKISIIKWLNSDSGLKPGITIKEWVLSIPLTEDHLYKIFEENLTQGLLACLKDAIESAVDIPICSFSQKIKTVYVYKNDDTQKGKEKEKIWEQLNMIELNKLIKILSHRFLVKFIQWKQENRELINSNDEWCEKEMLYSKKIIGQDICDNTRASIVNKWLYETVLRNFVEVELTDD